MIGDRNNPRRNDEGYYDLTAYYGMRNVEIERKNKERERFHNLLNSIFYLCESAGFEIENRIVLVDKKTGRVWR